MTEAERLRHFGFTGDEYTPVIKNFNLSANEAEYANRHALPTFVLYQCICRLH